MTKFIRYLKPYWYFALLAPSMMALEVIQNCAYQF